MIQTLLSERQKALARLSHLMSKEFVVVLRMCCCALETGKKILFFGNGGSAADAQHLAAELVVRYAKNRRALPAIALTTDASILTAAGNDFGFDTIFARQIHALGAAGDIAFALSTSGKSPNVLNAVRAAKELGMHTVCCTGETGGEALWDLCDHCLLMPYSGKASIIQELYMAVGHILCELIENHCLEASCQ